MATRRRFSSVRGIGKLRRTLSRIEKELSAPVAKVIEEGAEAIQRDAQMMLLPHRRTGALEISVDVKSGRGGFTAVIGPGARAAEIARTRVGSAFAVRSSNINLSNRNKHLLFQFFKGYWMEFGTLGPYGSDVGRQPARPFMVPAFHMNEAWIVGRLKPALATALERAAS